MDAQTCEISLRVFNSISHEKAGLTREISSLDREEEKFHISKQFCLLHKYRSNKRNPLYSRFKKI